MFHYLPPRRRCEQQWAALDHYWTGCDRQRGQGPAQCCGDDRPGWTQRCLARHSNGQGRSDSLYFLPFEGAGGLALRPAHSPEYLWYFHEGIDHGRGVAAELDPEVPGFHFWGSGEVGSNLFNFNGERVGNSPSSVNHVIWWNGDLSRELLNSNTIEQWHIRENRPTRLLTAEGASSINGTKANPNLQADLFGDWREEVIFNLNDTHLLVYTTTMSTEHRLPTLMHDPVYRVAIAWQNSSYNQPPHPGYYIATDMDSPPAPLKIKTP